MASSTQNHHQKHFPAVYSSTSAPPPTPSTQPNLLSSSSSEAAVDVLSRLLHRLPPTLSSPIRRLCSPTATTSPPPISLPDLSPSLASNLSAVSKLGFFQLTDHSIPSQLAHSAESESLSILNLTREEKLSLFPRNWPIGFDEDNEVDDEVGESLILDSVCSAAEPTELPLICLREFTREMEKVSLAVMEALSRAAGFGDPDPSRVCSLMWLSDDSVSPGRKMDTGSGKFYPYVIGLHYQVRAQKYCLLSDSGLVSVSPHVDSILVTVGDIAQVWSNGKLKKVRGRPVPSFEEGEDSPSISMSLLVTLPLDSIVCPLLPRSDEENRDEIESSKEYLFNSFSFEDYAWRVYHERIILKDPLDRYRI